MRAQDPASGPNRRRRPAFEGLESRSLLSSGLPAIGPTTSPSSDGFTPLPSIPATLRTTPTAAVLQDYVAMAQQGAANPGAASLGSAARINALDPQPSTTGSPALSPTPAEVAREYFTANFVGRYTIGPGHSPGQALTIHAYNTYEAGSNQSLKAKSQLILFTPASTAGANPAGTTVSAPAGSVTGLFSFFDQNFLQSGNLAIIDIGDTNQPGPTRNAQGVTTAPGSAPDLSAPPTLEAVNGLLLPTEMPWAFDATSAGAYTAPLGFTQGGGQLSIRYTPDAHPKGGTLGSGKIEVLVQGLIHTSNILNVVDKGIN